MTYLTILESKEVDYFNRIYLDYGQLGKLELNDAYTGTTNEGVDFTHFAVNFVFSDEETYFVGQGSQDDHSPDSMNLSHIEALEDVYTQLVDYRIHLMGECGVALTTEEILRLP